MTPVNYLQTDGRWRWNDYSAKGERTNIGKSGCGVTCAAMVIASLKNNSITPADTAKWSMKHGYKAYHQGTYYSYFVPQFAAFDIKCRMLNGSSIYHGSNNAKKYNDIATKAVKNGKWMICCMGVGDWTRSGHFVLWWGIDGDTALIHDPNSIRYSRTHAPISKLQYQVKYYWEIDTGEDELTQEEFNRMADNYFAGLRSKQPADWSKPAREWGIENKVMIGGEYKRPITREEAIQLMYAYNKNVSKKNVKPMRTDKK